MSEVVYELNVLTLGHLRRVEVPTVVVGEMSLEVGIAVDEGPSVVLSEQRNSRG